MSSAKPCSNRLTKFRIAAVAAGSAYTSMLNRKQPEAERSSPWDEAVWRSVSRARRREALRAASRALLPIGMLVGVALLLSAVVLALGGLGHLVSLLVPLTAFQAACLMLAAGIATLLMLLLQDLRDMLRDALFEEEEWEDEDEPKKPHLHPVLPFPKEDIVEASGECPCGSGKKYEECCGAGAD